MHLRAPLLSKIAKAAAHTKSRMRAASVQVCASGQQLLCGRHLPLARHAGLAAAQLQHLLVVGHQAGAVAH